MNGSAKQEYNKFNSQKSYGPKQSRNRLWVTEKSLPFTIKLPHNYGKPQNNNHENALTNSQGQSQSLIPFS